MIVVPIIDSISHCVDTLSSLLSFDLNSDKELRPRPGSPKPKFKSSPPQRARYLADLHNNVNVND